MMSAVVATEFPVKSFMRDIFATLYNLVRQGQPVTLATVVSRKGSLPMSRHAKMLALQNGDIYGTIGGGILEADVIEKARYMLPDGTPELMNVTLTETQIEADGLICGGTVEIFLEPFAPDADLSAIEARRKLHIDGQTGLVVTILPPAISSESLLIGEDGILHGTSGSPRLDQRIRTLVAPILGKPQSEVMSLELSLEEAHALGLESQMLLRVYVESVLPNPTAYLFGGGHVALALAKLLPLIGFDYVVIDDREEFVTAERFPEAALCLCHAFDAVFDELRLTPQTSYLIILTRGHAFDKVVLEQALQQNVKYIGMIGSQRKVNMLFDDVRQHGATPEQLAQVHAPIGLKIGADTPEEIAVSIAAELINIRRGGEQ